MVASEFGDSAVVQMLLDKGANIDLLDMVRQWSMVWCGTRRCRRATGVCVWQA